MRKGGDSPETERAAAIAAVEVWRKGGAFGEGGDGVSVS
jgi:hypothetical protein